MTALVALFAFAAVGQSTSIDSYVQKRLEDATFTARVKTGNQAELAKINKDIGQSYRFKFTSFKVKEPFKIRAESVVEDTNVTYILNGTSLLIKIPRARISSHQNLSESPGRRQTMMDFGILTPSLFKDFFRAKFVRADRATGNAVFDLTYEAKLDDTSRHRIWIDPAKKYITRREWYNQRGRQMAVFTYESPVNEDGIWMPTRMVVRNNDNKVAGETYYDSLKVNTGLEDSLFSTK